MRRINRRSCLSRTSEINSSGFKLTGQVPVDIPAGDGERLLTIEELAERLQYSVGWVRHQVKFGRIPVAAFNSRAWRFHWPTVLAALQKM
jgi:hypothetical protein